MGLTAEEAIGISKKYTRDSLDGVGALKGKNATIKSIEDITGGHRVTFSWTSDSGVESTSVMDVMDGEQGPKGDTGETGPEGAKGDTGNGIASIEKTGTSGLIDTYTITFTDGTTTTYQVTNGSGSGASSADRVSYNNSESSLEATNVQEAIDELDNMIGTGGVGEEGEGEGAEIFNLYEDIQSCNANEAVGDYSHAEGMGTVANGIASHAEGFHTTANTNYSHTEGQGTTASGINAHAEGGGSTANGQNAHAEGNNTQANGNNSHAEGSGSRAIGAHSHAEGSANVASAWGAHAEGDSNTSSGENSHTEGSGNTASGNNSHAGGYDSQTSGDNSFVHGLGLRAIDDNITIIGKYNQTASSGNELLKIGAGTDDSNRRDIVKITSQNVVVNGDVFAQNLVTTQNKNSLVANRNLSNIEDTTTTALQYFEKEIEQTLKGVNDNQAKVGNTYIVFTKENNVTYVNTSTDMQNWTKQATNLTNFSGYGCFGSMIIDNAIVYTMLLDVNGTPKYNIYYSTNLTTWTKANALPNTSAEYEDGFKIGFDMLPFMYSKNNTMYLAAKIKYNSEIDYVGLISSTNGVDWTVATSNILEVGVNAQCVLEDGNIIRNAQYYTSDGTTWSTASFEFPEDCELVSIGKYNNIYYLIFYDYSSSDNYVLYKSTDLVTITPVFNTSALPLYCGMSEKYEWYSIGNRPIHITSNGEAIISYSFSLAESHSSMIYGIIVVTDLEDYANNCYWIECGRVDNFPSGYGEPNMDLCYSDSRYYCKPITDLYSVFSPWKVETNPIYEQREYEYYQLIECSPFTNEVRKAIDVLDIDSGSGTSDYPDLSNKPSINGVELVGNKTSADLHITGGASSADDVTYDNTDSGLSATTVQDAIDEVAQSGGGGVGTVINLTTLYSALFNQTVTLTGTYDTYTTTFDSTGHATVNVFYVDTYAVTCQGETDSVTVTAIGLVINADVFHITTVNITTSDSDLIGETISVYFGSDPTDVRASLTFDSNLSVSFQTEDIGTYNIVIGYSNPVSFTVSSVGGSVSVTYNPTPTGSSVTPVNNVRNWLDSAKVFDKNYTTISQVLSDTTTLQALISSQNANDYLVRSTSWVSNICGNSTAMSYIGLNNYSANTLLADSTWCTGICNSTYFESVLNVKVPTMTSNTTPSGECFGSSIYDNNTSAYDYYLSFNGVKTIHTGWAPLPTDNASHIGYQYATGNNSNLIMAVVDYNTGTLDSDITGYIQCNNNGSWQSLNSFTISTPNQGVTTKKVVIDNHNKYNSYRILFNKPLITGNGNTRYCRIVEIQFYGREDI